MQVHVAAIVAVVAPHGFCSQIKYYVIGVEKACKHPGCKQGNVKAAATEDEKGSWSQPTMECYRVHVISRVSASRKTTDTLHPYSRHVA
jgi:hypothetical protein